MKSKINETKSESDETRCWIENSQTQILRAELIDGSIHLCPYAWLVWVEFSTAETTDRVKLIFNSHTVSIVGMNLRELVLAFQRTSVECVKAQPQKKCNTALHDNPVIQDIQIEDCENFGSKANGEAR